MSACYLWTLQSHRGCYLMGVGKPRNLWGSTHSCTGSQSRHPSLCWWTRQVSLNHSRTWHSEGLSLFSSCSGRLANIGSDWAARKYWRHQSSRSWFSLLPCYGDSNIELFSVSHLGQSLAHRSLLENHFCIKSTCTSQGPSVTTGRTVMISWVPLWWSSS